MGTPPIQTKVVESFARLFGHQPEVIARAPGRVNLIGEHTDYNDGFVLPMAIDRAVWIAASPTGNNEVEARSLDYGDLFRFSLDSMERGATGWGEYLKGVAWAFGEAGHESRGWRGVITSSVPPGAGLSSSAALELAAARVFAAVSEFDWDADEAARLCHRAENEWIGVASGVMDQLISARGLEGHALMVDCRSLAIRPVRLPAGVAVAIMDTMTRRELRSSVFNLRREECAEAARVLGIPSLRDATPEFIESAASSLGEILLGRGRHVVLENERTLHAAEAMDRGDSEEVGRHMNESHESLRVDYEVSSRELDRLVDCARAQPSCYGARMTGAGFGGCAVAFVRAENADEFTRAVSKRYEDATKLAPQVYICHASDGAALVADRETAGNLKREI